jgi:myo-inositol-1(or 4)-monophosphatase
MSGINDQELQDVYAFAVQLGKDAGQMLMDAVHRRIQSPEGKASTSVSYVEKENSVDIVTKTDHGKLGVPASRSFIRIVADSRGGPYE